MPDDVLALDATDLTNAIRAGRTTARAVTEQYLRRIEEVNGRVNAVLEVNPRALDIASELDRAAARGPLHGVPVLLKDNIDTGDELHTSAGAWNLAEHRAERDAPVAARLRAAGAVILGKANMTEWANFTTFGMPNGYSSRGGQVRNPWGDAVDVGGSSSGSAAAVAACLAPIAIGTETSGSILSPAWSNGVLGLKPTVGLVPRTGIIPISSSQDTAGPLARSARDAALVMQVISGRDDADDATSNAPAFAGAEARASVEGARFGVLRDAWTGAPDAERAMLEEAVEWLRAAGAEVVDAVSLDTWQELRTGGLEVLVYEFKRDLNAYLAGVKHGPSSLREVIRQNEDAPDRVPYGQLLLLAAEATSGTLTERAYLRARARDLGLTRDRGLDVLFGRDGLHAVLSPGNRAALVGAKAGYPSVCVPVGVTPAGPAGLTFTGPAWSDARLLGYAAVVEAARGPWRAAPTPG